MAGWRSFKIGLAQALHYWQLLGLFSLVSLILALLLALLPGLLALPVSARQGFSEMQDGLDTWMLVDLVAASMLPEASAGGGPSLGATGVGWLIAILLLPLLAWLPSAFLTGGALAVYREAPEPFSWRRFWQGGWSYWGPFLLLGLLQGGLFVVLFLPGAITAALLISTWGWLVYLLAPLLALMFLSGLAAGELARAYAVVEARKNIFALFFQAVGAIFRRPAALLGLYVPALVLLGVAHAAFRFGLLPLIPAQIWLILFLATQVFVVVRLWARLVRLAGVVELARWM